MCARAYRMTRRTDSAEETRRRIVHAAFELHAEHGISATSMRDIAARADVAVGSVYHHFPTYDDVISACGAYTVELTQPPDASILEGFDGPPAARLHAVVAALHGYYQRFPGFERIRGDGDKFAPVAAFVQAEQDNRRALLRSALRGRKVGKHRLALAFAMLDIVVYRGTVASGLSHEQVVEQTAQLLSLWLLDDAGPA